MIFQIKNANVFIDPIVSREKWITIRYDFFSENGKPKDGDPIEFLDEDGEQFASSKAHMTATMPAHRWVSAEFDGHKTYSSVGQFLSEMRTFYPDAPVEFTEDTLFEGIWWYPESVSIERCYFETDDP